MQSGHLQSIRNRIRPRRYDLNRLATARHVRIPMTDGSGDRLAVVLHRSRVDRQAPGTGPGVVLLVHGLGGSAESVYMRASAAGLLAAGFNVARVDLRSAGESKATTRQTYHAGKTDDLRDVLRFLADQPEAVGPRGEAALAVMGFSLGGAMTLKLLGEPYEGLPIDAGVAVSAPLDLVVGSIHLSGSLFGLYEKAIVRTLRRDATAPGPDGSSRLTSAEAAGLSRARTLPEFDDALTAPRHGWRDALEYYEVNSAEAYLPRIAVPTLVIHALDDPMIPSIPYLRIDWDELGRNGQVQRAITPRGGHVGFHQRGNPMPWYVGRARDFLLRVADGAPGGGMSE